MKGAERSCKDSDIGIVNACSCTPTSASHLVGLWKEENGWNINLNIVYYPYPNYEPFSFLDLNKKMKTLLKLLDYA